MSSILSLLVERAMGIEPTALAWEARVLPLYDARLMFYFTVFCLKSVRMRHHY